MDFTTKSGLEFMFFRRCILYRGVLNHGFVGGRLKSPFGLKKNPRYKSVGDFCLFL
jgi:hypothetical protein